MKHHINYTMLCDFYELTMANGYLRTGLGDRICYFDLFFRNVPDGGGFAIAAGWTGWWNIFKTWPLTRTTLPICGARAASRRNF